MNTPFAASFVPELATHLRRFLTLSEEALSLVTLENQALSGAGDYQPFEFYQGRKTLLLRIEEGLNALRKWRLKWQRLDAAERASQSEVKLLLQTIQDSLVKVLVLDRENQQALLKRGLVPARHVPSFAGRTPHYATQVYQRHAS